MLRITRSFLRSPLNLLVFAAGLAPAANKPIDFQREIRPILSDNCFQCHGPDSGTRMAGLRLDLKQNALEARKRGAAIVPGNSAASLLYQRISATDAARRMPPEFAHKTLTAQQIDLFKRWIDEGAPWQEPWVFKAPVKSPLPAVHRAAWVRNPIDNFVLARLESQQLAPAPVADKHTLVRRVALDLTGLPPKPAEIEQFVKDTGPAAYEHMIDRYLASPHYGENRARYWLDAARYADTHGIHIDNYREMWPYRDWVIQAYNHNMRFSEFTIEQLAGDLLPKPTLDQRIATGFQRCNVTTNEAGIIEDEYAEIYAKDRADTTAAVWLGLTVGCATCHDHKFDPISQKDFYSLGAFFRNTTQNVMDDNIPDTPPVVLVPRTEDRAAWEKVSAELAQVRTGMEDARKSSSPAFDAWLQERKKTDNPHPLDDSDEIYTADIRALAAADSRLKLGDSQIPGQAAIYFPKPAPKAEPAKKDEAGEKEDLVKDGVIDATAPKLDADRPFSISVNFLFPKAEQGYVIASQIKSTEVGTRSKSKIGPDKEKDGDNEPEKEKKRGWVIDIGGRVIGMRLIGEEGKSIEIRAAHLVQLKHGTWNHLVVSYDGSRQQSGLSLYLNGHTVPTQGRGDVNTTLRGDIAVDAPLVLGRALGEGAISDFRVFNREVTESEAKLLSNWQATEAALAKDPASLTDSDRTALQDYFLIKQHEPYRKLIREQNKLNDEARAIARRGATTLVMQERTDTKPFAYVLYRGAYDQHRQRVEAATPAVLPPMTSDLPRNRLGFAKWLFTEENPVTARVTVNRMWQEIFGTGIVKTVDDFGSQGEPPSHPELLDWLAVDFRENGWDLKRFYKQVLMSATYRQSAVATPDKIAKDPENRLLSRGPRFRLDGEVVRDYALAASGLLAGQIGGPSVKPYQPNGIWEAVAMEGSNTRYYKRDSGDGLYRRSMYTFWKRSAPPASMDIFNAPTRETCTVRRERTDTPLQALVTMNDVQFVEAARALAERSMQSVTDFDERLNFISTRLLARTLSPKERLIARKAFDDYRRHYEEKPKDADQLLSQGERKPDPSLVEADYAAYTMLTNQMLNLDEVLNK